METKENYTSNNALVKLPREIIHEILKYVPESTVVNLAMSCKGMSFITIKGV
jgi:hypothetical protein